MTEQTDAEKNWLTANLVAYTRIVCVMAIAGILLRRCYLAGTFGFFHPLPVFAGILRIVENLIEAAALLGTPACGWLWFRLIRLGYLRPLSAWDYALVFLLYFVAYRYLPPPHDHDVLHFGASRS